MHLARGIRPTLILLSDRCLNNPMGTTLLHSIPITLLNLPNTALPRLRVRISTRLKVPISHYATLSKSKCRLRLCKFPFSLNSYSTIVTNVKGLHSVHLYIFARTVVHAKVFCLAQNFVEKDDKCPAIT